MVFLRIVYNGEEESLLIIRKQILSFFAVVVGAVEIVEIRRYRHYTWKIEDFFRRKSKGRKKGKSERRKKHSTGLWKSVRGM